MTSLTAMPLASLTVLLTSPVLMLSSCMCVVSSRAVVQLCVVVCSRVWLCVDVDDDSSSHDSLGRMVLQGSLYWLHLVIMVWSQIANAHLCIRWIDFD